MAKKKNIEDRIFTREMVDTLAKVSVDLYHFSSFVYVIHPIRGKVPFLLYPYQKGVLLEFLKNRFNIILKFRQAGITELISMYCLWLAMYHETKKINIISIKDTIAKKVLKKIKFMYKNLPWYLQTPIVNGRNGEYGTVEEIEFSNGSVISSIPTTEDAGRSEALSLLVIDEAAIVRWASTIWAAAFPALSTGGSAIINSTPYGIGSWYHQTWVDAINGSSPINPIRLRWTMHPERDQSWYDIMASTLGPRRTAQEIEGDFLGSGNPVFDLSDIREIESSLNDYHQVSLLNGQFRRFLLPEDKPESDTFYLGADCSTGRSNDYSAFTVMDKSGEEFAVFKGRIPLNKFTRLLGDTGRLYNWAKLAPETNDIGMAVTLGLQDEGYPNLYYSQKLLKRKGERNPRVEEFPGWLTSSKNRPVIIEGLEKDIRENNIIIKDPFFCNEAFTFIYDASGRPVAMGKGNAKEEDLLDDTTYSDDSIMAKAITNHIRKVSKLNLTTTPV